MWQCYIHGALQLPLTFFTSALGIIGAIAGVVTHAAVSVTVLEYAVSVSVTVVVLGDVPSSVMVGPVSPFTRV